MELPLAASPAKAGLLKLNKTVITATNTKAFDSNYSNSAYTSPNFTVDGAASKEYPVKINDV
jgi:hypothetical protein